MTAFGLLVNIGGSLASRLLGSSSRLIWRGALMACAGMLAIAGGAAAETPSSIDLNHGQITLGANLPGSSILPAPVAGPNCPAADPAPSTPDPTDCGPSPLSALVPNLDPNGKLTVTTAGTTASVSASEFDLPIIYVSSPADPSVAVPIRITAPSGLAGQWRAESGALRLTGNLRIEVITGAHGAHDPGEPIDPESNPAVLEKCAILMQGATWATGQNPVMPGEPFATPQGLSGNGAVSTWWEDLPDANAINGGDCSTVGTLTHDRGSIWLSSGIAAPAAPDICFFEQCPPPQTRITKLRLLPLQKRIRAGKTASLKVRVVNRGDLGGWVRVQLRLNRKRGVKLAGSVRVWAKPGTVSEQRVTLKTGQRARGRYRIRALGGGNRAVATVKVTPRR